MPVGKPPKNNPKDVDSIQKKIDAYFKDCEKKEKRPTYTGLALALGYCDRSTIWRVSQSESPISQPIKRAMLMIECVYEEMLGANACTGAIFALKNRGWKDKSEMVIEGNEKKPLQFQFVDPPDASTKKV